MKMKQCISIAGFLSATLMVCAIPAFADIYQYTDDNGVVHFSNLDTAQGKKLRKVHTESRSSSDRRISIPAPVDDTLDAKKTPRVYGEIIKTACDRHGVDPALVHALVKVESDFNPRAISRKGAVGLMQLMPQTALNMNVRNSLNPYENIDGGVKYLRYLINQYSGNLSLALAAYNSGETAVNKWGTIPPFKETQDYVQRILNLYNGTGNIVSPRYTIYVGYEEDGAILLTDDPSRHKNKSLVRRTGNEL
jgi:hypothetical protein